MKKAIDINKDNCKILICCHKICELPKNPESILFPIQVGAAISSYDLKIQRDDVVDGVTCDNISNLNPYFCELTALYWAWKNIKKLFPELKYIGLNHYRRYFCMDKRVAYDDTIIRPEDEVKNYNLSSIDLSNALSHSDVILAKRKIYPYSIETDYCVSHFSDDIRILENIIHNITPEYDEAAYDVLKYNNKLSHYNMFIMRIEDFDQYCSWLFCILNEAKKRINISNYSTSQQRIWGYMGERLLNIWCYKNAKKVMYKNILKFSEPDNLSSIIKIISNIRAELSFLSIKHSKRTRKLFIDKVKEREMYS